MLYGCAVLEFFCADLLGLLPDAVQVFGCFLLSLVSYAEDLVVFVFEHQIGFFVVGSLLLNVLTFIQGCLQLLGHFVLLGSDGSQVEWTISLVMLFEFSFDAFGDEGVA